ncbi:hypothetical protein PV327_008236 [Microctonus hyperodae]|uniref:Uncharacterized protein n=1 Tax=Microctonus hyperodae TaxID=165561 RepID=A0AA39F2N9_MICHY|nr:hypothetical protein PV327_008236 [Microctonus hyperodae]
MISEISQMFEDWGDVFTQEYLHRDTNMTGCSYQVIMFMPDWDISSVYCGDTLGTVLSDDIWNKFELEDPLPVSSHSNYERTYEENMLIEQFGKAGCIDYQEIRHHDCMWAGLCISKEHSRTMPTKKDNHMHRKVAAGRSLLISRATASSSQQQQQHNKQKQHRRIDSLESDGDSTRSETPHTLSESDSESDCEVPIYWRLLCRVTLDSLRS